MPETEYTGEFGPTGVPLFKERRAVSASEEMRMSRLTADKDPAKPINWRVWNGQRPELSDKELLGEEQEARHQ
jgi:hypothetical protein